MYESLETSVDLPTLEQEVLRRWQAIDVFARSVDQTADRPRWVVYEGPPTANGLPGLHHIEARAFKDAFPRYKTMKGFHVPRRAGWDCHGLPVELEVEKELGLTSKQDIERFGVAEFNARCRESVLTYVAAWERMSERMGYWVDFGNAYRTMDSHYVESVWWALKQIYDKGLLVEDYRVAPYCPRCQTALSSHELGQPGAYRDITSPSAFVRFPIVEGKWAGDTDLLVWTTTPWTLVSNTAVAVHPDVTYVRAQHPEFQRALVVAEPLAAQVLGEGWEITDRCAGRDLERVRYQRPFELIDIPDAHYVVLAEFVTTDDGTGLVHMAPAFGADDLAACRRYGLPLVNPINSDGKFDVSIPLVGGILFKDADQILLDDLRTRGLLYRHDPYVHAYPHCWRCDSALLYYAMPSWYIRTTAIKDQLLAENERTNWFPAGIKHGRYGDWLTNNVDWALSRSRYWGTPLPIWRCEAAHVTCVGSLEELGDLTGRDLSGLDPHRPYVDAITFACPTCGEPASRVPEVIDVWFDSGAMPFAQHGAPHRNREEFTANYPAQFICEAIDQTRGWFYTLMAVGTLAFERSSYENVLCVGLLLDAEGRKMSKSLGNVLEPMALMDRHGADAVRWFMLAAGSPWSDRRVSHEAIEEAVRKVLLTYWNTASFQALYGRTANWTPGSVPTPSVGERPILDRWVLSELTSLVAVVDDSMEAFDIQNAARHIAQFIDDLSNWYVRRSRRRFWAGDPAALATLHECLNVVTRLLAPVVPFITDRVWQALVVSTERSAADSVHLAEWPRRRLELVDSKLSEQMATARRLVELGRAARASSGVKIRQPLARALVAAPGWETFPEALRCEIAEELNVLGLDSLSTAEVVDFTVRPQFRALGKRFGSTTQRVAKAVREADPAQTAEALRTAGFVVITVEGEDLKLDAAEVEVTETPRSGWLVSAEGALTIALDLEITPELRRAGLARDVVRLIQQARKDTGLEITDRIEVWWHATNETGEAVREHHAAIAEEILAVEFAEGEGPDSLASHHDPQSGLTFWLQRTAKINPARTNVRA
jgi:isoleucyl-tRNA synthetase